MNKPFCIAFFLLLCPFVFPPALETAGGHRGAITALIRSDDKIISAGEDGFIVIWDTQKRAASERFQLTPYGIKSLIKHPTRDEICIIESGGMDYSILSVWNYSSRKRLFSLQSGEEITFVNYSAGGSFIITANLDGSYLTLLNSQTGEVTSSPELTEPALFAMTGRAERNMLVYQSKYIRSFASGEYEGMIAYLDLNSASVTGEFNAPGGLASPIVFGNNRFLAGINREGLLLVDAASGTVLDKMKNISQDAILCPADTGFYCVTQEKDGWLFLQLAVDQRGNLVTRKRLPLPTEDTITAFTFNGNAAFGTRDGSLFFLAQNDKIVRMAHNTRQRIIEFAAAETSIAFLTESGELSFLPLDYRTFNRTGGLTLKERTGYTRISPLTVEKDQFLLWQTSNTARAALLDSQEQDAVAFTGTSGRFPLRSVSSRDNKILFMDAAGNISVYDQNDLNKKAIFTFSSAGAIDTAFISHEKIILCRSVISGNSPFLIVNINTGETLPLPHRSRAGIMVYSGGSGEIYGVAVEQDDGLKTTIIGLTDDKTDLTGRLIHDYPGEAIIHSLAESAGTLAIATNQGAAIFGKEIIDFERTEGLPVKILGCPQFFLSLDSEGNIAWHNNKNGKLLAVFSLYREKWILSGNREFSGGLFRP